MMKKNCRLLALALAVMMALSCCAFAEEAAPAEAEDPILFTMDGQDYHKSQVDAFMANLLSYGYLESAGDYDTAIEYIIQNQVIDDKITEWGLDQHSEEEKAAFAAEAQQEWDELIDSYVSYFLTEDSAEAREEMKAAAETYYRDTMGLTLEDITADLMSQDSYDHMLERLFSEQSTPITSEAMQAYFDETVAQQKEMYDGNINLYELYKNYGQEIWYQPAGYRGVLHILLGVDEALLNAYQDAQNLYEESVSGEENEGDSAALLAAAEQARQAVLDSEKAAIDDIYARLEKGESFESLIALYGEDPGMEDPEYLKTGYEIHPESFVMGWDPAFVDGAFQEKMQKPGDVSDPVVSSFGIHILYYLRDVPAGPVELNDEIRETIREYLENVAKNDLFYNALETWEGEHAITLNTEAIENAKAAASAGTDAAPDGDDLGTLTDEELQQLFDQLALDAGTEETEEAAPEEAPAE